MFPCRNFFFYFKVLTDLHVLKDPFRSICLDSYQTITVVMQRLEDGRIRAKQQ